MLENTLAQKENKWIRMAWYKYGYQENKSQTLIGLSF